MFKRYCTQLRRRDMKEPDSFNEYIEIVNSNLYKRLIFYIQYRIWEIYKKLNHTTDE